MAQIKSAPFPCRKSSSKRVFIASTRRQEAEARHRTAPMMRRLGQAPDSAPRQTPATSPLGLGIGRDRYPHEAPASSRRRARPVDRNIKGTDFCGRPPSKARNRAKKRRRCAASRARPKPRPKPKNQKIKSQSRCRSTGTQPSPHNTAETAKRLPPGRSYRMLEPK